MTACSVQDPSSEKMGLHFLFCSNYSTGEMLGGDLYKTSEREPKLQTFQGCYFNGDSHVRGFSEFFCFMSVRSISLVRIVK